MKSSKVYKLAVILTVLAMMLTACGTYTVFSPPTPADCTAAGYPNTDGMLDGFDNFICWADGVSDGQLNNSYSAPAE